MLDGWKAGKLLQRKVVQCSKKLRECCISNFAAQRISIRIHFWQNSQTYFQVQKLTTGKEDKKVMQNVGFFVKTSKTQTALPFRCEQ